MAMIPKRAPKKKQAPAPALQRLSVLDWTFAQTGRPLAYWLTRVEALIRKSSRPLTATERGQLIAAGYSPGHDASDPAGWMSALTRELMERAPRDRVYDGNMWLAAMQGIICAVWYARLQQGKACDPVRPVSDRQPAYQRHVEFVSSLIFALQDPSNDAIVWPEQGWQHPFAPEAKSGKFR